MDIQIGKMNEYNEYSTAVRYYILQQQSIQCSIEVEESKSEENAKESGKNEAFDDNNDDDEGMEMKEFIFSSAGSVFSAAGPVPYQGDILENPELVWSEDVWDEDKEKKAQEVLNKQGDALSDYWRQHYINKAGSYWNGFYKRNQDHFYKDRHYLHVVFPELQPSETSQEPVTLLEVGCGVGNAALPLLEVNPALHITAIDFAKSAITILQQTIDHKLPVDRRHRITAAVNNIAADSLPCTPASMNYVLCMFVMSAISPEHHLNIFQKFFHALQEGGKLFLRDYARYDEAQLRFKKGCKLDDRFYVRQDGTCSYFFTVEELGQVARAVGFEVEEIYYIYRQYANRQQRRARYRVWIHAKLRKPLTAASSSLAER